METGERALLNKRFETTVLHRNGTEFPIEMAISPLVMDGTFLFSAFIRDIRDRRQADRALLREAMIVHLLQGVAAAANIARVADCVSEGRRSFQGIPVCLLSVSSSKEPQKN